jgi:hypothetical protein
VPFTLLTLSRLFTLLTLFTLFTLFRAQAEATATRRDAGRINWRSARFKSRRFRGSVHIPVSASSSGKIARYKRALSLLSFEYTRSRFPFFRERALAAKKETRKRECARCACTLRLAHPTLYIVYGSFHIQCPRVSAQV